ncbi:hypothetical protein QOZ80_9AG0674820 [Eleusine coracana subsp. coracana]|nr:hypothetical protein QOZ80_9AG0674820 [Eleusine coracana subsp. coracana]
MAASTGDGQNKQATAAAIADEDDLFELDIDLLGGRDVDDVDDKHHLRRRSHCSDAVTADADDDGRGHALLANCLLPVSSVSNAVPVAAAGGAIVSTTSYPYSGYYSPPRRLFTGGSSKRFLFGRSARFCFSSRGFETMMGNYFQRY